MTNYGFHTAMARRGSTSRRPRSATATSSTSSASRGWALGGEQSGHIIDLGFGPSGDGIASALLTLEALGGRDLAERDAMKKLPQRLVNIRAADRAALSAAMDELAVESAIERERAALEGRGRVLVRASGTEPLIRVMVEAPSEEETDEVCDRLTVVVQSALRVRVPLGAGGASAATPRKVRGGQRPRGAVRIVDEPAGGGARPQSEGPPDPDDRDRRRHRHRPVPRLRQGDLAGRTGLHPAPTPSRAR